MQTYTTITYTIDQDTPGPRVERSDSFIRRSGSEKPTHLGAARMISAKFAAEGETVPSSRISVSRVEMIGYNA